MSPAVKRQRLFDAVRSVTNEEVLRELDEVSEAQWWAEEARGAPWSRGERIRLVRVRQTLLALLVPKPGH